MTNNEAREVLGVSSHATADEIKSRYRELARRHHPDTNGGDATSEWLCKQINAAYGQLKERRRAEGRNRPRPAHTHKEEPKRPEAHGPGTPRRREPQAEPETIDWILGFISGVVGFPIAISIGPYVLGAMGISPEGTSITAIHPAALMVGAAMSGIGGVVLQEIITGR